MQELYRNADNSARFVDSDLVTETIFTRDDLTGLNPGDTVVDYQGHVQTILELSALPAGIFRVVLARL